MPLRLVIVRHGEAAPGESDELRPLTPEGRRQARAVGRALVEDGLHPDAVVSSPLVRARETARLLARETDVEPETDERLAPGAAPAAVRAAGEGRGEVVVLVCHQPDCGRAVAELGGGEEPAVPPGARFVVELDG